MENVNVTPEQVKELYDRYPNKQHFVAVFGTTKFHLAKQEYLERMYAFLNKKLNKL